MSVTRTGPTNAAIVGDGKLSMYNHVVVITVLSHTPLCPGGNGGSAAVGKLST